MKRLKDKLSQMYALDSTVADIIIRDAAIKLTVTAIKKLELSAIKL